MIAIQLVSTRIGRVTGKGVTANLREHTPKAFLTTMVVLLVLASTHQYRRRHRRHGQGAATGCGGGWPAFSCAGFWCYHDIAASVCVVLQARANTEMANAVFVCLRHSGVSG